ncbi:UNVERIFIED_CONTAM: hypothetical protein Sindi_1377400 [Sesamum indicum]
MFIYILFCAGGLIDEDIKRHNELLDAIRKSPSEVGQIVARHRKDFTKEFFAHLHTVAESYYDNPTEQNAVANLRSVCLAAVEAYDTATENIEALNAAELKLQDIINSPSVDAACRKIDNLAEKNQLDSALVLMITKAWSAAKESNMMKDEVKDVLFHLYKTARGNLQRLMPKEIRILKYLLTIEDPEERMSALKDAFTPGEELEGQDIDCLYTTPEQLHTWIRTVVDAYHFSREGTLIREARDLMNPKLRQFHDTMEDYDTEYLVANIDIDWLLYLNTFLSRVQREEVMEDTTWYIVFVMQMEQNHKLSSMICPKVIGVSLRSGSHLVELDSF